MIQKEFTQKYQGRTLKWERRTAGALTVQRKPLPCRYFVSDGLPVDVSEIKSVHSVGEQLLVRLNELHAKSGTRYARNDFVNLPLDFQRMEALTSSSRQRPTCFPANPPPAMPGQSLPRIVRVWPSFHKRSRSSDPNCNITGRTHEPQATLHNCATENCPIF